MIALIICYIGNKKFKIHIFQLPRNPERKLPIRNLLRVVTAENCSSLPRHAVITNTSNVQRTWMWPSHFSVDTAALVVAVRRPLTLTRRRNTGIKSAYVSCAAQNSTHATPSGIISSQRTGRIHDGLLVHIAATRTSTNACCCSTWPNILVSLAYPVYLLLIMGLTKTFWHLSKLMILFLISG